MSPIPSLSALPSYLPDYRIRRIVAPYDPIPEAILGETATHYIITILPNIAGISTFVGFPFQRCATPKAALEAAYPDIVEAWHTKKRKEKHDASKVKRSMAGYAYYFQSEEKELRDKDPGVTCHRSLLPGMRKHWGELRSCETYWRERPDFQVCKGCRVSHHGQPDRGCDRGIIMTQGARVPVCEVCAAKVVEEFGIGH